MHFKSHTSRTHSLMQAWELGSRIGYPPLSLPLSLSHTHTHTRVVWAAIRPARRAAVWCQAPQITPLSPHHPQLCESRRRGGRGCGARPLRSAPCSRGCPPAAAGSPGGVGNQCKLRGGYRGPPCAGKEPGANTRHRWCSGFAAGNAGGAAAVPCVGPASPRNLPGERDGSIFQYYTSSVVGGYSSSGEV